MKYSITRTEAADLQIRSIILYIAEKFGKETALKKLNALEQSIFALGETPNMGMVPKYPVLKRQGYKVLVLEKNLVFYKINENKKEITIYAVIDNRKDYLNIIKGL